MEVPEWLVENTPELTIQVGAQSIPCQSGLQFASRYAGNPDRDRVFDYLPDSILRRVANLVDFPRVLAFDKWTGNSDGRQTVFVNNPQQWKYQAVFIDQGFCFNAGAWNFPDSPFHGVYVRNLVYDSVNGWDSFEPVLSQIQAIDLNELSRISLQIPPEWYEHNAEALTGLIETLHARRSQVRKLIMSLRDSTRNPFPNWKN